MLIPLAMQQKIINWQRHFHQHPEISFQEFETARRIKDLLTSFGLNPQSVGETGLAADLAGTGNGGDQRCLLLRADIDALPIQEESGLEWQSAVPGAAHLCGHDGHTAALLGAAAWLSENRHRFSGTIRFVFQQAEELASGAPLFVDGGWLKGVDSVAALHFWPPLESGKIACEYGPAMAGCERFEISVSGKTAHISTPQFGLNAMIPATQILLAIQSGLTQQFSPFENILIGIGLLESGTQYNVIPAEARMKGTTRFFDEKLRLKAAEMIRIMVENISKAHGMQGSATFSTYQPAAINDDRFTNLATLTAKSIVGESNVLNELPHGFAGDDFSWFQDSVPGVYVKIGTFDPARPQTGNALHHAAFTLDDRAILIAGEFFIRYALNFFGCSQD